MKKYIALLLLILPLYASAQKIAGFPFDMYTLSISVNKKDSIMPVKSEGGLRYVNTKTGKQAFAGTYIVAYPFIGKAAVVLDKSGFGIIGRNGNWIKKPFYNNFRIADGSVAVMNPHTDKEYTFDLWNLRENCGYINCAMPSAPESVARKDANGIWIIYTREKQVTTTYSNIPVLCGNRLIAVKKGKFGVVDVDGKILVPFEYSGISIPENTVSRDAVSGLLKGNEYYYYDISANTVKLITKSKYRCTVIGKVMLKNALGIYNNGDTYNILFKDGTTLKQDYDLITENGLVAIKGDSIYLLNDNKTATLFYTQ